MCWCMIEANSRTYAVAGPRILSTGEKKKKIKEADALCAHRKNNIETERDGSNLDKTERLLKSNSGFN